MNLSPLPKGLYTLVCEFFPFSLHNASATASIGAGSIATQHSITVPADGAAAGYVKNQVQPHHTRTGLGTDYIYFDLHGGRSGEAHLIVYMVKNYVNNVSASVFDKLFTVENGRMEMLTDLDLNSKKVVRGNKELLMYLSNEDVFSVLVPIINNPFVLDSEVLVEGGGLEKHFKFSDFYTPRHRLSQFFKQVIKLNFL